MQDLLTKYFNDRMSGLESKKEIGPVITISREYGCWATRIAELLAEEINTKYLKEQNKKWKAISKHILNDVAQLLNRDPQTIAHIFGAKDRGLLTDIIDSFSPETYSSDDNIIRTISNVVKSFGEQGNTIIVGRASSVLLRHIPQTIHVKLVSPFEKRVERIKTRFNISEKEAAQQIKTVDERRARFMSFYDGNKPDDELFDIVLNREFLKEKEIVSLIIDLAKFRGII
jgi:cytidylate kinase